MRGSLIITIGISGSGKSTWAHEKWIKNPNLYTIVNRDKIRELLFGYTETSVDKYYTRLDLKTLEEQVTQYEETLISEGLDMGKKVIIDATNLTHRYLKNYRYWNVPSEVVVFEIELDKALDRDISRSRMVGEVVITKQYNRFVTLMQQLSKEPIDFTPVELIQNVDNDRCFISESPVSIAYNGILTYDDLYTKSKGDCRPDWVVKEQVWRRVAEDSYIVGVFDDSVRVIRRAKALGLATFNTF